MPRPRCWRPLSICSRRPSATIGTAAADAPPASDVITEKLEEVLAAAAPTDFVPIFIGIEEPHAEAGSPIDFENVVDGTRSERLVVGIRYLTLVSEHTTRPLEMDLLAAGCSRAHGFWLVSGISASCVPAVVRRVATRAPVRAIDYDGPIVVGGSRVSP
jgi:hypothetical protein